MRAAPPAAAACHRGCDAGGGGWLQSRGGGSATYLQQLLVELVRGEGGGGVSGRSGTRRQPQRDELVDLQRQVSWAGHVLAIVAVAIAHGCEDDGVEAVGIDRTTRTNRGGSNKGNGVSEEEEGEQEEEAGLILKSVCSKRLGYCGNVTRPASHVKYALPVGVSRLCTLQARAALQRDEA
jgi:hypothetical protein